MTAPIVCDASAVVAALVDGGSDGRWVTGYLGDAELLAPQLLPFEVGNVVRRLERQGLITSDAAAQAHLDLLDLTVELWPYSVLAARVWDLRPTLTAYDAAYVAVAEASGAALITLDRRLAGAPGVTCTVLTPPDARSGPG